ncbi:MAG: CFI-box-CTERM domain-containing protein [Candidatus Hadarchaeia archaeon]
MPEDKEESEDLERSDEEEQGLPEEAEELEEVEEGEEDEEFSVSEIIGVPSILCPDDYVLMDITDTEFREVEERKYIFMKDTESHMHLKYECPECGGVFYHDTDRKRQGCFIATAAYGTPFSKDINVLRRFRDSYLVHREWGKKLVSAYYTLSPPVANLISKSENLRKVVRKALKPIVEIFKRRENER